MAHSADLLTPAANLWAPTSASPGFSAGAPP